MDDIKTATTVARGKKAHLSLAYWLDMASMYSLVRNFFALHVVCGLFCSYFRPRFPLRLPLDRERAIDVHV